MKPSPDKSGDGAPLLQRFGHKRPPKPGLQPLCIPNGMLIFKSLRFTEGATAEESAETFAPLFDMAKRGLLRTKVEATYALSEAQAAITHASQNKRNGKIVFQFG